VSSSILRPPQSALDRLVGSRLDGKYHIERLLGRGGMGAVFRALHLGTDRTVALKVIVPDLADRPGFLARFEREARACGRLRHPNIVDVTDFGYAEVDGRRVAYLVMEYLDGCSLADVLRDDAQLPVGWVIDVLEQACSALEEAHRAGILHRDLKPENIWLEPNRRGGYTVKVLDFRLRPRSRCRAPCAAPRSRPSRTT
jgi:serine/threonine protein kinase